MKNMCALLTKIKRALFHLPFHWQKCEKMFAMHEKKKKSKIQYGFGSMPKFDVLFASADRISTWRNVVLILWHGKNVGRSQITPTAAYYASKGHFDWSFLESFLMIISYTLICVIRTITHCKNKSFISYTLIFFIYVYIMQVFKIIFLLPHKSFSPL